MVEYNQCNDNLFPTINLSCCFNVVSVLNEIGFIARLGRQAKLSCEARRQNASSTQTGVLSKGSQHRQSVSVCV